MKFKDFIPIIVIIIILLLLFPNRENYQTIKPILPGPLSLAGEEEMIFLD